MAEVHNPNEISAALRKNSGPLWYDAGGNSWLLNQQNFAPKVLDGASEIIEPAHFGGWNYLYVDGHVKWHKPANTLGKNPVNGQPNTDLSAPRGPWTVFDGDDM
jgi:prepilin-type processing-associated H-X9-DG protein